MSVVQINQAQKLRPYKIDVYGLQDNYIGTLQSYNDSFIGQIVDPELSISDDGTQSFSCSIPKFYIDPITNTRINNPRWGDIDKGVLAENTRILKVFIQFDNETKVFPFIIDSITDKRDNNFSVYRQITCSGLAFAELGKIGYKLELSETVFNQDESSAATINYWLDKVFPNIRDEGGKISKWLTPWSYEIKMNWDDYPGETRKADRIYDDTKISSWKIDPSGKELQPVDYEYYKERERLVEAVNSNKYNITQSIAEAFEVFCVYEYKCNTRGRFIKTYTDENKNIFTGRKVIFCNRAIKRDNPLTIAYQKNLESISRTSDTTELYTKLYVPAIDDSVMDDGQISIANTSMNPLLDDFILNFDYLYDIGSITETQKNSVEEYKIKIRKINEAINKEQNKVNGLQVELNKLEAKLTTLQNERDEAQNQAQEAEQKYESLPQSDGPIQRTIDRPIAATFFEDKEHPGIYKAKFGVLGIEAETVKGYHAISDDDSNQDGEYDEAVGVVVENAQGKKYLQLFDFLELLTSVPERVGKNQYYGILDDNNYLSHIITSKSTFKEDNDENDNGLSETKEGELSTLVYFTLNYSEDSYYLDIRNIFTNIASFKTEEINLLQETIDAKQADLNEYLELIKNKVAEKQTEHEYFENIMGSALREGYWTPENTGGIYENVTKESATVTFDVPDPDDEELGYKYTSIENQSTGKVSLYPYIELPEKLWDNIKKTDNDKTITEYLKDLVIVLKGYTTSKVNITETEDTPSTINTEGEEEDNGFKGFSKGYYSINPYGLNTYYFELEDDITKTGDLILEEKEDFSLSYKEEGDGGKTYVFKKLDVRPGEEENITSLTNRFTGSQQLKMPLTLRLNAGYTFSYKNQKYFVDAKNADGETIKIEYPVTPILLLNNDKLNYEDYKNVGYGYSYYEDNSGYIAKEEINFTYEDNLTIIPSKEVQLSAQSSENTQAQAKEGSNQTINNEYKETDKLLYPRIILNEKNINRNSTETFNVSLSNETELLPLTRYDEYTVLHRVDKDDTAINLKISKNNTIKKFFENYYVKYQVSHANEQLYRDAYEVALENSKPRFSYEVSLSNLPHEIKAVELGQLVHINDYLLGAQHMRGYVSGLTYKLNEPKSDSLIIQNYKTKFEDLFSTITASSEAMKTNQRSYNAAAASFDSKGNITKDVLQSSIDSNDIAFNFSNTMVTIDDQDGIILTNKTAYSNGVYGQVALRGGGIFLSNNMDLISGRRTWNTGITPNGINASLITAGQLDTNLIRIFSGSDMAFQWNAEGLNAYKRNGDAFSNNDYIRFSGDGLHYKLGGIDVLSLDWDNGLLINANEGATQLDGKLGLVVYDGKKSEIGDNWLVRIGKFTEDQDEEDTSIVAGMRLYQIDDQGKYVPTLDATNGGHLWLKNVLTIGGKDMDTATVGISGREIIEDNDETLYAIWAGKTQGKMIKDAAFYVKHDGFLKAENASISGNINAETGRIGKWILSEDYLAYEKNEGTDTNPKLVKVVGLYSGQAVGWDEESIRIFAGGSNSSNRNFYVTEAGGLFATQARFGNQNTYIELITDDESSLSLIQSDNYQSNYSGWKIDSKGHAEFENVKIRGELSTVVFKKEEVSAVGGKLYISPSQYYEKATLEVDDDNKTVKIIVDNLNSDIFENNQKVQISGTLTQNDNNQNIQVTCKVTAELDENGNVKGYYFNVLSPIENLQTGTMTSLSVIATGIADTEQYILIDASKEEGQGPFIDVRNKIAGTNSPPQVRLGDLTGLQDSYFQLIEGYGLYSQNAYLTGQLVLPNAGVTNQDTAGYTGGTNYDLISTDASKTVRLWAGGKAPISGGEAAPFVVTQDGTLYASKGIFSGELQTAGIIIDSDDNLDDAKHKRFYIAKEYKESIQLTDYILNMDINGLSIFDGKIAAYSDSKNDLYGTADKYLEPKESQTGIDKVIPYFYTYDDYNDKTCDSRWVAKSGHIFNCYRIRDDEYEITSITLKDGLNFYRAQTNSLDDYLNKEKEIYNATPQASFTLMSNCLNYSGTKFGIKMEDGESLIADTNIRGTIGMKGKSNGKNGIIVSPAIDSKKNITIGIDIISLILKE